METDLDGGNKGAPSLDNLVLLLEKGLKVTGVSDAVHDFSCLCTNTKGTRPVFRSAGQKPTNLPFSTS